MEVALSTGDTNLFLSLSQDAQAEFLPVYNLVSISVDCRDTSCGLSLCRRSMIFSSPIHRSSSS